MSLHLLLPGCKGLTGLPAAQAQHCRMASLNLIQMVSLLGSKSPQIHLSKASRYALPMTSPTPHPFSRSVHMVISPQGSSGYTGNPQVYGPPILKFFAVTVLSIWNILHPDSLMANYPTSIKSSNSWPGPGAHACNPSILGG